MNEHDLADYNVAVHAVASPELAAWAHHGRLATGIDPATEKSSVVTARARALATTLR